MTTQEIANRFHELAQESNWPQIHQELYSTDAVSIEPASAPMPGQVDGIEAINQKGEGFRSMVEEFHGGYSKEPIVAGNHFSVAMGMDITMKGQPRRMMDEICVYEVQNGKIVKEQFFF